MENKVKVMHKVLSVVLVLSLGFWSLATYGALSINTLILLVLLGLVVYSNSRHTPDEREWQIHLMASYGAFITTVCFLLIFQTVEFLKTGKTDPLFGYILAVLMLSQLAFNKVLRRSMK